MNEKMLAQRAREFKTHIGIITIVTSLSFFLGYYLLHFPIKINNLNEKAIYILIELSIFFLLIIYYFLPPKSQFKLDHILGIILSMVFGFALCMLLYAKSRFFQLYLFLITQMIFHYSEYISVIIYHFDTLEYKSFLLDHSNEWIFALVFNYLETIIGNIYFYDFNHWNYFDYNRTNFQNRSFIHREKKFYAFNKL